MDKEIFNLENFPTSESAKRQLKYITSGFYDNSYVGKWLFQVMGQEFDDARKIIEELPVQSFPETATWGLMYHEVKWGLPVRENLSYEERRRMIYAKRDYRAPMTPYRMEKYLEDVTGFEVHIADVHDPGEYGFVASHPNVFKAYFIGEETLDSKLVHKILNRLKQSHTAYTVCDRIYAVFDHSALEQILLKNINLKIKIPFWYEYMFDGSWLLDGSVTLNHKRRYGLMLGMMYQIGFRIPEFVKISAGFTVRFFTQGNFRAGAAYIFGVYFWDIHYFDGTWRFEGSGTFKGRAYGALLGVSHHITVGGEQQLRLSALLTKWSQHMAEAFGVGISCCFAADFWEKQYGQDAKVRLNICMESDASGLGTAERDIIIETKTSDYWHLDGSLKFDGARRLNSVYIREVR